TVDAGVPAHVQMAVAQGDGQHRARALAVIAFNGEPVTGVQGEDAAVGHVTGHPPSPAKGAGGADGDVGTAEHSAHVELAALDPGSAPVAVDAGQFQRPGTPLDQAAVAGDVVV